MNAVHSRETQNMLSDFNKAQEVLKDKISALQILYVHTVNTLCWSSNIYATTEGLWQRGVTLKS